jgi:hypothetical protein
MDIIQEEIFWPVLFIMTFETLDMTMRACNVKIQKGINDEPRMIVIEHDGTISPHSELISQSDIIVNGVFQDIANPTRSISSALIVYLSTVINER